MDAQKTWHQLFAFALVIIAVLSFFVWLLGPGGPKTAQPSAIADHTPAPTIAAPAPIKIEVHANKAYECLRVYQGSKELHWQCFKVEAP